MFYHCVRRSATVGSLQNARMRRGLLHRIYLRGAT